MSLCYEFINFVHSAAASIYLTPRHTEGVTAAHKWNPLVLFGGRLKELSYRTGFPLSIGTRVTVYNVALICKPCHLMRL